MHPRNWRKLVLLGAVVACLLTAVAAFAMQPAAAQAGLTVELAPPPIMQEAASPEQQQVIAGIAEEAGISAYFSAGQAISLATVADQFRTVEAQTGDYIVGTVDVIDYPEEFDLHMYVHKDGWFMAYYLAVDPAAKAVDWRFFDGASVTTLFEKALSVFASEAGVVYSGVTFYDFRNPNANRMMVIAENEDDGNDFTVKVPASFVLFERSWGQYGSWCEWALNSVYLINTNCYSTRNGLITAAQFAPDTTHTVALKQKGGLVLIYRVP